MPSSASSLATRHFVVAKAFLFFFASSAKHRMSLPDQIIPDVLSEFHPTPIKLQVKYGSHAVELGNELTPTQVKDIPHVSWNAEPNALYTLILTDPDAPSRSAPKAREWHHWTVINIPGDQVSKGQQHTEYVSSAPPKGSGKHRYIFLLYKQDKEIHPSEKPLKNNSGDGRANFSAQQFAKKYHLHLQDVKFFVAEWDEHVPQVYKQLGN